MNGYINWFTKQRKQSRTNKQFVSRRAKNFRNPNVKCLRCDGSPSSEQCRFKDTTCSYYNKMAHIVKTYRKVRQTTRTINMVQQNDNSNTGDSDCSVYVNPDEEE